MPGQVLHPHAKCRVLLQCPRDEIPGHAVPNRLEIYILRDDLCEITHVPNLEGDLTGYQLECQYTYRPDIDCLRVLAVLD